MSEPIYTCDCGWEGTIDQLRNHVGGEMDYIDADKCPQCGGEAWEKE
jgi:hypothetical protein